MKNKADGNAIKTEEFESTCLMVQGAACVVLALVGCIALYAIMFAPFAVTPDEVQCGPIVPETMGTGTTEARVKATISHRISGRVARVLVDQGDLAKAGQSLVRLDDAELL